MLCSELLQTLSCNYSLRAPPRPRVHGASTLPAVPSGVTAPAMCQERRSLHLLWLLTQAKGEVIVSNCTLLTVVSAEIRLAGAAA